MSLQHFDAQLWNEGKVSLATMAMDGNCRLSRITCAHFTSLNQSSLQSRCASKFNASFIWTRKIPKPWCEYNTSRRTVINLPDARFNTTFRHITHITYLLQKLAGLQLVKSSPHFMEPEGSLPYSQLPANCHYPEPAQSSPYHYIPLPEDAF
jgi:hypothetical protein